MFALRSLRAVRPVLGKLSCDTPRHARHHQQSQPSTTSSWTNIHALKHIILSSIEIQGRRDGSKLLRIECLLALQPHHSGFNQHRRFARRFAPASDFSTLPFNVDKLYDSDPI